VVWWRNVRVCDFEDASRYLTGDECIHVFYHHRSRDIVRSTNNLSLVVLRAERVKLAPPLTVLERPRTHDGRAVYVLNTG
jgi:hypothetical protein